VQTENCIYDLSGFENSKAIRPPIIVFNNLYKINGYQTRFYLTRFVTKKLQSNCFSSLF